MTFLFVLFSRIYACPADTSDRTEPTVKKIMLVVFSLHAVIIVCSPPDFQIPQGKGPIASVQNQHTDNADPARGNHSFWSYGAATTDIQKSGSVPPPPSFLPPAM